MKPSIKDYTSVCVWPATQMDYREKSKEELQKFFADVFGVRIYDVRQVETVAKLDDGSKRVDILFRIHDADVSHFVTQQIRAHVWFDIQWFGDWLIEHRGDYPESILREYNC